MKHVSITKKSGKVEQMSAVSFARWSCLIEAFEFIADKAHELNVDIDNFIKPVAIEHYIEERFPSILHDVEYEIENGLLS
jgi:hypothetical protein